MSKLDNVNISSDYTGRVNRWGSVVDSWEVILGYEGETFTVDFYKGLGHEGKQPVVGEVLEGLFSDAILAEEDLIYFGEVTGLDGEEARESLDQCKRIDKGLDRLLGEDRGSIGEELGIN